jgi:hypothetical protein
MRIYWCIISRVLCAFLAYSLIKLLTAPRERTPTFLCKELGILMFSNKRLSNGNEMWGIIRSL